MSLAVVGKIVDIQPHPDADKLEIITVRHPLPEGDGQVRLVTGKHYRLGDLGVWLRPGAQIPGWLAHDLWLVGKKRAQESFQVRQIEIRGVASPGLWCGSWYRNDTSKESRSRAAEYFEAGAGLDPQGFVGWPHWNRDWQFGDSVDQALGIKSAGDDD